MASLRIAVIGAGKHRQRYHLPTWRAWTRGRRAHSTRRLVRPETPTAPARWPARYGFERAVQRLSRHARRHAPDAVWVLTPFTITTRSGGLKR
jgi:predicted dehydrogenase